MWGQKVKWDFPALLLSSPITKKTGSRLLWLGVKGQTSWLHHVGQILYHPPNAHTYTHLVVSIVTLCVSEHNTYSHILSKYLVKQQCYHIPPMLQLQHFENNKVKDRRSPSPCEPLPWQHQHLSVKDPKTFCQGCCHIPPANQRGGETEKW